MARRPDITAEHADDRELMHAHPIQDPPAVLLIGLDRKERRAERILGEPGAEESLARPGQAHKG
ncbi:MAG: thioredoxin domain-containing protein [Thiobacillus sp.]